MDNKLYFGLYSEILVELTCKVPEFKKNTMRRPGLETKRIILSHNKLYWYQQQIFKYQNQRNANGIHKKDKNLVHHMKCLFALA